MSGAERIVTYVYKENERRNASWARTFDMEQNIRDNQATELEVALYVRGENAHGRPLEDAELAEAGLDRKGTRGERGVLLGRFADESIIDALRNVHTFTVDDAVRVVEFARGDRDVQREGLRVMLGEADEQGQYSTPGSITEARRVMQRFLEVKRAQEDAGWEQGGLGLGFGESLMDTEFNRFFGKYQTRRLKELAADRGYLRQLVGKKLSAKQAEKYGVDVNDPEGLRKRKEELDALAERWKNPALHDDLMEEMRAAFKQEYAGESWLDMQRVDSAPLMVQSRELGRADFSVVAHDLYKELYSAFCQVPSKGGGKVWARKAKAGTVFRVCQYPDILNRIVPWNGNVITKAEVARKLLNKHHFSMHDVARLPHALWDPVAVFEEKSEVNDSKKNIVGRMTVITDIRTKNNKGEEKNALCVLALRVNGDNAEITDVVTAFSRDEVGKYKNLLEGKQLLYADKARAQQWAREEGRTISQLLTTSLAEPGSKVMLKENMPDVNFNFPGGDRKNMPEHVSMTDAKDAGMFKDGVMRTGNAVITEPGVTHFSVDDAQHASPHEFEKFDLEHIGSGEGAQAYGYGLYFSGNWGVNRSYHGKFGRLNNDVVRDKNGKEIGYLELDELAKTLNEDTNYIRGLVVRTSSFEDARDLYEGSIASLRKYLISWEEDIKKAQEKGDENEVKEIEEYINEDRRRLPVFEALLRLGLHKRVDYAMNYLVDLDVEDGELLDWDKWNGEEGADPDIGRLSDKIAKMVLFGRDTDIERQLEALDAHIWKNDEWDYYYRKERENADDMFVDYWASVIVNNEYSGEDVYRALVSRLGSAKEASEFLLARGIKGIRYADGATRDKDGEKSYNYVIFDPDVIKIKKVAERKPWSSDTEDASIWEDYEGWRARRDGGVTHFSLGGERAATFGEMQEMGFTYFDPADGKRKFAMDTRGVRLSTGFTMGDVNVPAGGHKDVSLAALLHYPELYRAYPELKGMRVRLYRDELSAVGGFYAPEGVVPGEGQHIAVNVGRGGEDKAGRLLNVLLHESQHAVQHHEGWARGAGDMGKEEAIEYVKRAIAARKKLGVDSEWAKFNMAYLKTKLKTLQTLKAGDELEREIASVYVASHGEQEARVLSGDQSRCRRCCRGLCCPALQWEE